MAGFHWPGRARVPFGGGARVVGHRAFAAQFKQTPAIARTFVVKGLGEFALVIKRPAVTTVVNGLAVKRLWPPVFIELRQGAKG